MIERWGTLAAREECTSLNTINWSKCDQQFHSGIFDQGHRLVIPRHEYGEGHNDLLGLGE